MAISKTKKRMASVGCSKSTKAAFDDLAQEINERNSAVHGDKAVKISHDDVLMELVRAYRRVGL